MYKNEDFERFFLRYKADAYPAGESIQSFCIKNNVAYNLFERWYRDTRKKIVEVKVDGSFLCLRIVSLMTSRACWLLSELH